MTVKFSLETISYFLFALDFFYSKRYSRNFYYYKSLLYSNMVSTAISTIIKSILESYVLIKFSLETVSSFLIVMRIEHLSNTQSAVLL